MSEIYASAILPCTALTKLKSFFSIYRTTASGYPPTARYVWYRLRAFVWIASVNGEKSFEASTIISLSAVSPKATINSSKVIGYIFIVSTLPTGKEKLPLLRASPRRLPAAII